MGLPKLARLKTIHSTITPSRELGKHFFQAMLGLDITLDWLGLDTALDFLTSTSGHLSNMEYWNINVHLCPPSSP